MLKHPIIEKKYIDQYVEIKDGGDPRIKSNLEAEEYEVLGWVKRTAENPYDFILYDREHDKHYLAQLQGRTDGWPLFSVQPEGYTCARSKMGSDWNCLLCVKYFGTVCKAR